MNNFNMIIGRIVRSIEAFKGSKPVINKDEVLAVRSICKDKKIDEYPSIKEYLMDKLVENDFEIVNDEEILEMVIRINEALGTSDTYTDEFAFDGVKSTFEAMGCVCDYAVGKKGSTYVGISMWFEKELKEPKFVEVICV
ncbi:conserved hypothetical protein [Methanococcus vannielii SB]|uniref:Uncharacterized protein n=1 Tax=Methanococcus vannielii (strain ATCC 35089 / DSM 1224 / JCM 13029 / OCM 148 / SB) TaxID=406327 RepID=A6UQG8_METVS|nr:DUF2120 family protein [Methanococcus vannielii]ABR54740.1 conserved hypothetical protein [Methanococcus vannielii SB]